MAATREVEVRFVARLDVDDRTRAALVALGWTPPSEPRSETPGDPDCPNAEAHSVNGGPWRYCPCGWVEASPDSRPDPLLSEPRP